MFEITKNTIVSVVRCKRLVRWLMKCSGYMHKDRLYVLGDAVFATNGTVLHATRVERIGDISNGVYEIDKDNTRLTRVDGARLLTLGNTVPKESPAATISVRRKYLRDALVGAPEDIVTINIYNDHFELLEVLTHNTYVVMMPFKTDSGCWRPKGEAA